MIVMDTTPVIDSRLKLLSHSTITSLHTCPRKCQLTKIYPEAVREETVHTAFGKMFGEGIQALLSGASLQEAILRGLMQWTLDLDEEVPDKSVWLAISALEKFSYVAHLTGLADYEVAVFGPDNKLACELSFCIILPDGFYYRGYIDVVLRHKVTGTYLVVDVKTSGAQYSNSAKYINSAQNIGYSIVLDKITGALSQYDVMYYEFLTKSKKFIEHSFVVSSLQRAKWLRDLLIDLRTIKLYSEHDEWPMHGESCASFGSACQFIDVCTMSTHALMGGASYKTGDALQYDTKKDLYKVGALKKVKYDIVVTFEELLAAQLNRN